VAPQTFVGVEVVGKGFPAHASFKGTDIVVINDDHDSVEDYGIYSGAA